ncbi:MAG TPA: single-stranded-DNA-specific exonuclease RecJ [Candidatus Moranbacteria bacterium]|nr:single-stranded-DNA-specific exonuclease RecJ [Candidatus Moranbacteria bacterium]
MIWKTIKTLEDDQNRAFSGKLSSLHPVVLKLLKQRGFEKQDDMESFLFPNYEKDISDPFLFRDMKKVIKRLKDAKNKNEKILIFGDYDADGITSSLTLKSALEKAGFKTFIYIPHKEKDGYGLNFKALKNFSKKGISLVITVDCGISNIQEIEQAKKIKLDVIITDHHHIPPKIPKALAIINPKLQNSNYPFEELAGVGVAFKLAQAIYETFLPDKKEQIKWLLDIVAIGTVADMVPLVRENRTIVKFGLLVLSKTKRIGLQEIFKTGRILIDENNFPTTQKISFQVAPRINSASRMSHAEKALFLLDEKDRATARIMALELESQNSQRQKETQRIATDVEKIIKEEFKNKSFIFIAKKHFPMGILGLVAGRVSNKFNKPTAILKKDTEMSRGSFRSIPQINIIKMIEQCSELLENYGGHSQAAGITVKNENLEKFYNRMNSLIEKKLQGADLTPEIKIDTELNPADINFDLVDDLLKMEPFGQGNKEPIFLLRNLIIQDLKWLGNGEKHLKLFLRPADGSPKIFEAIGFNLLDEFSELKIDDKINIIFNLSRDEWNGNKKIQMKIIDIKSCH